MDEDDSAGAPPKRKRARGVIIYASVAVLAATGGVGTTLLVRHVTADPVAPIATPTASMNDGAVYNKVEPGVVDISADLQYLDETAEGTGFVINAADGLILTNNHVIDGATSVTVTPVMTGKTYSATVVGYDLPDDIAVLQVRGIAGLHAVDTGDSDDLAVGTSVIALGNEAGQGGAPTAAPGVISSTGRSIVASDQSSGLTETLHGMLQTSADIRPGDSGGPLANARGQVIGINTAAGSGGSGMAFAGYAIPINTAMTIAVQIASGHAGPSIQLGLPAFLGVLLPDSGNTNPEQQAPDQQNPSDGNGAGDGINNGGINNGGINSPSCVTQETGTDNEAPASIAPASSGALVDGVVCGTAAQAAGLEAGDVITSFAGHSVSSANALSKLLNHDRPGTKGLLTWVGMEGDSHSQVVILGTGPAR
ncbi:MAG TPA: trypsin-like peptidase domain-containing protein [Streptosporangiaceae bacterium]